MGRKYWNSGSYDWGRMLSLALKFKNEDKIVYWHQLDDFWWEDNCNQVKIKQKTLNKPHQQSSPSKPQTYKKSIVQKYYKKILTPKRSLNSIQNPIIIEQIGKEIFLDEDKAIFWTASETLLAVNKQAVHTISYVITLTSRNIEFQSILIFHNNFPTFRLCHGRKVSFPNRENFVDKSFSFQEYYE